HFQVLAGLFLAIPHFCRAGDSVPTPAQARFFETRVRPLLVERCFGCHGPDKQRSGLRLDSAEGLRRGGESGTVLVTSDRPDQSYLLKVLRHQGSAPKMPPKDKLSERAIADLLQWVNMGAP